MKKKICKTFIWLFAIALIAGLLSGCSNERSREPNTPEPLIIQNVLTVTFPGANEEQMAAMNAYVEDFKTAYPKVKVFVDYPETLTEEDLADKIFKTTDVLVLPEDQVDYYVKEKNSLMPLEYYAEFFGIDYKNMYDGADKGSVDGRLYYVRMPRFSAGSGDVSPVGLAAINRTRNPDAAAAFALFFYTPEVPENGIWSSSAKIID